MVYLEINKKNALGKSNIIEKANKYLSGDNNHNFVLFYMEGCGPCNATRPEWSKLKNVLSNQFLNRPDIMILAIDKDFSEKLKNIGSEPNGFPTMRYITKNINENYEDSNIETKDRTIDSFIDWIKLKTGDNNITKMEGDSNIPKKLGGSKTKKRRRKWSNKYKRSINCRKPKGFSQKQYCKYGRKHK